MPVENRSGTVLPLDANNSGSALNSTLLAGLADITERGGRCTGENVIDLAGVVGVLGDPAHTHEVSRSLE